MKENKNAFTLIEVIIVVVIISFLIVLVTAYLRTQIFKGNDARRKADVRRIGIAAEEYEKDNNCYPLAVVCNPGTSLDPYLDKIPCDPVTGASYYYEHEDSTCPSWYRFYSALENESDSDYIADIGPTGEFSYEYSSPNAPDVTGSGIPDTDFYGCFSGVCTQITWDPERPGPICDPNFQNPTCYGQCSNPANECMPWN